MVDALALGASGATHEGSSPFSPTKKFMTQSDTLIQLHIVPNIVR